MKKIATYKGYIIKEVTKRDYNGVEGELAVVNQDGVVEYDGIVKIEEARELIEGLWSDRVIGSMGLCNTASLNIYEIDDGDERILAGLNNDQPRWYKLNSTEKGFFFKWGGNRVYLDEIIRVCRD